MSFAGIHVSAVYRTAPRGQSGASRRFAGIPVTAKFICVFSTYHDFWNGGKKHI